MAWLQLRQESFAGGQNLRDEKRRLGENESQLIEDLFMDRHGVLYLPKANVGFNSLALTSRVVGIFRHYCETAGEKRLVAVAGQYALRGVDASGVFQVLQANWQDAARPARFLNARHYTFFMDGKSTVKAYHTVSGGFADVIPAVPSTPTAGFTAGWGALSGYFVYKVTHQNAIGESNASASAAITVKAGSPPVQIGNMTAYGPGDEYTNIYRCYGLSAEAVVDANFYLIGQTKNTTYVDTLPGGAEPNTIYQDNYFNATAKFGVLWRDRAFWAKGDEIYVSEPLIPTACHLVIVVPGEGEITGLAPLGQMLVIFQPNSVWALTGYDQDDFAVSPMVETVGCIAPNTIVEFENNVWWMGLETVYQMDPGGQVQNIGEPIRPVIRDFPRNRVEDYAVAGYYDGRYYLALDDGTTKQTYVYDIITKGWTRLSRAFSAFARLNHPHDTTYATGMGAFMAGDDSGFIHGIQTASTRLTSGQVVTAERDGGAPEVVKLWRAMRLDGTGAAVLSIHATADAKWQKVAPFYLNAGDRRLLNQTLQGTGLEVWFYVSNTGGSPFSLRGLTIDASPRPGR